MERVEAEDMCCFFFRKGNHEPCRRVDDGNRTQREQSFLDRFTRSFTVQQFHSHAVVWTSIPDAGKRKLGGRSSNGSRTEDSSHDKNQCANGEPEERQRWLQRQIRKGL